MLHTSGFHFRSYIPVILQSINLFMVFIKVLTPDIFALQPVTCSSYACLSSNQKSAIIKSTNQAPNHPPLY